MGNTIERPKKMERIVLVGLETPYSEKQFNPLHELEQLVKTAGGQVVGRLYQKRDRIIPTYYIGTGKAEELSELVKELNAHLVIFDNDLTGAQVRNLEKLINIRVIDRSELILAIFAKHARSNQAKLQVELAQLEYELPRLKRMWTHLSRFEGGIGTRGPGEKQIEEDKRVIRNRIAGLKRKLKVLERRKEREVKKRREEFTISFVGYTNAGKSTLMNALTGCNVYVSDQLFATLDTKTRLWCLGGGRRALLSDTVGFIRNIPHHLIASFHATLEEATRADLLLHVVDASDKEAEQMIITVESVLKEIGCEANETILIFNKIDLLRDNVELGILSRSSNKPGVTPVAVSAVTKEGFDILCERVIQIMEKNWVTADLTFPVTEGRFLSFLAEKADIFSREYKGTSVEMRICMPAREWYKVANNPSVEYKIVK
ncbi:MAG: GTPase HflX [Planctomycetota bacterium]